MKKLIFTLLILVLTVTLSAQEKVLWEFDENPADTAFWDAVYGDNSDSTLHYVTPAYSDDFVSGTGALRIDYNVQNSESWGGFGKIEHYHPDSNSVYDWSAFDTLSFMYKIATPQSVEGSVHLRVNLYDVSDAPDGNNTYDSGQGEFYYSFEYILDDSSNEWKEWKIALEWDPANPGWNGESFNRTGWSGVEGNNTLDLDKIKGFCFEFSIGGGGEGNTTNGTILIDKFALKGAAENAVTFFNGATVPGSMEFFQWGASAEVVEGAGNNDQSPNAIKWVQSDAWSGVGFNILKPANLEYRWPVDTLHFKMKAEEGVGNLRIQFESGAAVSKMGGNFDPITDNEWHQYSFPLSELVTYYDGTSDFDYTNITVLQILTEGNGSGKTVYLDDWWTGSPVFDLIAPEAPQNLVALSGDYVNYITWDKVPNETNESYSVYYSFDPITDVTAKGVEVLVTKYSGELLSVDHVLRAPNTDQDLTYYYAIECYDEAGNVSPLTQMASAMTNTAEGVPTINLGAPAGFVADGDLGEWAGITPIVLSAATNTAFIPANQDIDGDDDCSAEVYIAFDNEFMYVAYNVTDDEVTPDISASSWLNDAPDLFIGLYDWHGAPHQNYNASNQPDYHFRFNQAQAILDNDGSKVFANADRGNYAWVEGFLGGYTVEAKIALDSMAYGGRAKFSPKEGMRIPIDIAINDADGAEREGIITYSSKNEDKSHETPSRWTYTWIGDKMVGVKQTDNVADSYKLEQNYPNPFNPTTTIKFSLKADSDVSLKVYDAIGREVTTLVNSQLKAGTHQVDFNAANLASGIYFYRIEAGSFNNVKKMMLLK